MGLVLMSGCFGPSVPCAEPFVPEDGACVLPEAEETPAEEPRLWSADEAMSHLAETLAYGVPEPTALASAYARAVLEGDPGCPEFLADAVPGTGQGLWVDECTATSGWTYSGTSLYSDERTESTRSLRMTAAFTVTDADGDPFQGGGEVLYESASAAGVTDWSGQVGGVFGWRGEDGWLGEARGEALFLEGTRDDASHSLRLDGGVEYAGATIGFTGFSLDTATCAGDAPVDAPGTVEVRDPTGVWFVLDLPGDCTGCGELRVAQEPLGPACVSLEALVAMSPMEAG